MTELFMPRDEAELCDFIRKSKDGGAPVEVCGFRSKRDAGRPLKAASVVSTAKLSGIVSYEPNELVITVKAGTPVHEIEAALFQHNQELAFEPLDLARIFSPEPQMASAGALVAMNISGPRRILRGAARDYVLGIRAVNGLGESFKSGGRVLKNVTGVDFSRGLSGSWGTLAILTEISFKVLPRAPESRTIIFLGLADEAAVGVMSAAMGTPYEVSGTIHLDAAFVARLHDPELAPPGTAVTALRVEGRRQSVVKRVEHLRRELAPFGETYELDDQRSRDFWGAIRSLAFLSSDFDKPIWRVAAAPSKTPLIARALSAYFPVTAAYDWSGGLAWLELAPSADASATEVRRVLAEFSADSMLMRAPKSARGSIEVFHPLPFAKMRIVQAVKKAFDPAGILNPGRMYAGV